jgi:hypothetical protein
MGTAYWEGDTDGLWDTAANWVDEAKDPYGSIPQHGDDVVFDGTYLGANRCATGPTAVVLLASITAQNSYSPTGGPRGTVCYAKCGMNGNRIPFVTIEDESIIAGGWIDTVETENDAAYSTGWQTITGGNVLTWNGNGRWKDIGGGTIGTVNAAAAVRYTAGAVTTFNATTDANPSLLASGTVTTLNALVKTHLYGSAITAAHMYGDDSEVRNTTAQIGTLYIYAKSMKVSLIAIAAGKITNGPYLMGWNQKLVDYDTGKVICDMSQLPVREGKW